MFFILELVPYVNWRKKWRKSALAHTIYFQATRRCLRSRSHLEVMVAAPHLAKVFAQLLAKVVETVFSLFRWI